jgi:hypothetical protein
VVKIRKRSRQIEMRLRIALCLLAVALIQPQVVLCVGPDGHAVVEFNPLSCSLPSSAAESSAGCIANPSAYPSDACSDTPISLVTLQGKSSGSDAVSKTQRTLCPALERRSSAFSFTRLCSYFPLPSLRDQARGTTQTTVLLI